VVKEREETATGCDGFVFEFVRGRARGGDIGGCAGERFVG